jgi:hypothetical protein
MDLTLHTAEDHHSLAFPANIGVSYHVGEVIATFIVNRHKSIATLPDYAQYQTIINGPCKHRPRTYIKTTIFQDSYNRGLFMKWTIKQPFIISQVIITPGEHRL